jgi:cytochrome b6-f complex iron-sulfur subunit
MTRRQLMRTAMVGTIGLFIGTVAAGSGAMLWPIKLTGFGAKIEVPKKVDEIRVGDPPLMVREGKFYLTRVPEGFMALYWKCPHLGCTVPWNAGAGNFLCPCHGSTYNLTGQNIAGPAPRPMDMMGLEIRPDGTIVVSTGEITQRPKHDPSHATSPRA